MSGRRWFPGADGYFWLAVGGCAGVVLGLCSLAGFGLWLLFEALS